MNSFIFNVTPNSSYRTPYSPYRTPNKYYAKDSKQSLPSLLGNPTMVVTFDTTTRTSMPNQFMVEVQSIIIELS